MPTRLEILHGALLGGALGDALGLPFEGLSIGRMQQIWGGQIENGLEMCLLPGRGLISNDTEHALLCARALLESRGDSARFARYLRGELRRWFYYLPAGIGVATLRASLKAAIFLPNTGVWSADNGPAVRAPILGAFFCDSTRQLREFCQLSTRLTHLDPRAQWGAFAVALAASESAQGRSDGRRFVRELGEWSDDSQAAGEMLALAKKAANSAARGQTTANFCREMGLENGVSECIFHTVPIVLQCWMRHQTEFRAAVEEIILCGGDTNTTATILGGVIGAGVGGDELPLDWVYGLNDFPTSRSYIFRVAQEMQAAHDQGLAVVAPRVLLGLPLLRNAVFLLILMVHAARRILTV